MSKNKSQAFDKKTYGVVMRAFRKTNYVTQVGIVQALIKQGLNVEGSKRREFESKVNDALIRLMNY